MRPGDAVHVMLGHSRWTAAARELARQQWGTDAGLTLIMTSLGALGALFFRGGMVRRVVTAYSGNSFPSYAPEPHLPAGLPVRRGGGRALVDPDPGPAPGGCRPGPAGGGHRLPGRLRTWPPTTAFTTGRLPVRPGGPGGSAGPRRGPSPRRRVRPATATWPSPNPCSRGCGGRGRPAAAWWPRWRRSSTTWTSSATGCGSRPTGSWPWSRHPSAPTPAGATPRGSRWPGTARTSPSGSMPPPRPGATSTPGPGSTCSDPPDHAAYLQQLGDDRLIGLRLLVRSRVVAP